MKFSLINVIREYDGMVDGFWLQNHTGTLESATEKARATEQANSNRITVAVVEELSYTPDHSLRKELKRLDSIKAVEFGIEDNWLHRGQKVNLLNQYFKGQVGTVQSFVWNTGEYIVALESGHEVLFRPSELEKIEGKNLSLSNQIESASTRATESQRSLKAKEPETEI